MTKIKNIFSRIYRRATHHYIKKKNKKSDCGSFLIMLKGKTLKLFFSSGLSSRAVISFRTSLVNPSLFISMYMLHMQKVHSVLYLNLASREFAISSDTKQMEIILTFWVLHTNCQGPTSVELSNPQNITHL
ncbi:hypothetical protein ACJX0J_018174 [Zea mays]